MRGGLAILGLGFKAHLIILDDPCPPPRLPDQVFIVGPLRAGKTRGRDLSGAYAQDPTIAQMCSDFKDASYCPKHYEEDRRPRHPHRVTKGAFGKKR